MGSMYNLKSLKRKMMKIFMEKSEKVRRWKRREKKQN
jgi:hypothetical protein